MNKEGTLDYTASRIRSDDRRREMKKAIGTLPMTMFVVGPGLILYPVETLAAIGILLFLVACVWIQKQIDNSE